MTAAIITIVVILVLVLVGLAYWRRRQAALRDRFGPEYDRTVSERGGKVAAQRELAQREARHRELEIKPLSAESATRYRTAWGNVQQQFVDAPEPAVAEADRLVTSLMGERGYPTGEFAERESVLSVEHSRTLEEYRAAHAISLASEQGAATTEDLRQAMVHYRTLFEDLLDTGGTPSQRPVGSN